MNIVTISSKNQITLPAQLLRDLGLAPKKKLIVQRQSDAIVMQPLKKSVASELAGSLTKYVPKSKLGKSWKEIMEETKKIAAKELVEKM